MAHLRPEQNERLRAAMRASMRDDFAGQVTLLARAIGVKQPSLTSFLAGRNGASLATAQAFAARVAKRPLTEVIGGQGPSADLPPPFPSSPSASPAHLPARVLEREPRYPFVWAVVDALVGDGVDPGRAKAAVFDLVFDEGQGGLGELALYLAAKRALAAEKGKAEEGVEVDEEPGLRRRKR